MSGSVAEQISLFSSQISKRIFEDATLRILESVLVCQDVNSLMEVTSSLREFIRLECIYVIKETAEKTLEQKLLVLEFFVRAFALVGDIESCLALRYEALSLRDLKSVNNEWLQVSHTEWMNFGEHSLDAGFYSITIKACENALLSLKRNDGAYSKNEESSEHIQVIDKIQRLKDCAVASASSHSVQAQTAEYLKNKTTERSNIHSSFSKETQYAATTMFRIGIKRRNARKLHECQNSQQPVNHE